MGIAHAYPGLDFLNGEARISRCDDAHLFTSATTTRRRRENRLIVGPGIEPNDNKTKHRGAARLTQMAGMAWGFTDIMSHPSGKVHTCKPITRALHRHGLRRVGPKVLSVREAQPRRAE